MSVLLNRKGVLKKGLFFTSVRFIKRAFYQKGFLSKGRFIKRAFYQIAFYQKGVLSKGRFYSIPGDRLFAPHPVAPMCLGVGGINLSGGGMHGCRGVFRNQKRACLGVGGYSEIIRCIGAYSVYQVGDGRVCSIIRQRGCFGVKGRILYRGGGV